MKQKDGNLAVVERQRHGPGHLLSEDSPAKLRRRLSGDLDDIVMMSLRKEPERRYASVEQFAHDIRRHLEGLPVVARRNSWSYRARKFAARHKLAVLSGALILVAIAGGVAATIRESRIAAAHERRAEQRFNDVRKLANSLMFEIHDAIRDLPGSTPARRLLVTRAQEYLDSLSEQSKGDASLQKELAAAYERVGDVLGYPYAANLDDKEGALKNYRKALELREPLAAATAKDSDLQRDLVGTYFRLAQVAESTGHFKEALAALGKAQPIAEKLAEGSHDPVLADHYAGGYYFTAVIQVETGDPASALQNYQRAASIRDAALAANPGSFPLRTHLAADYAGIAKCFELTKDLSHAIEVQSKAAAILEDVATSNPDNAMLSEYLGEGINRLATYRKENGETAAALETYRKAHAIFAHLVAADPKNSLAKSNFGFSNNGIARTLVELGKPAAAIAVYRESIATFEEMSPKTTLNRYIRTGLAEAYFGLGETYSSLAQQKNVTPERKREYWQLSRSSCQKSLSVWNEKGTRGELESGEQESASQVARCVATSESRLANLEPKQARVH